jgi:hypothetical protein
MIRRTGRMVDAQSAMPWLVATGVYVQFTALDFAAADAAVDSRDNRRQTVTE